MLGEDDVVAVVPPFTSLLGGSLREPLWARGEWGVYRIVASHLVHIRVHECSMLSMVSHFVLEFLKIFSINYNFFVFIFFFRLLFSQSASWIVKKPVAFDNNYLLSSEGPKPR